MAVVHNPFISVTMLISIISSSGLSNSMSLGINGGSPAHLKYLGVSTNRVKGKRETIQETTSYYFLSQNSASWTTAESDCKAYLGDEATLLYVETSEELNVLPFLIMQRLTVGLTDNISPFYVRKYIASTDDTGATYWVGGVYDSERRTFLWGFNGPEFGLWTPWEKGFPDTKTVVTRVCMSTKGLHTKSGLKFKTEFQTVSHRYICELKRVPDGALPCNKPNDLILAVDSSSLVGSENNYFDLLAFVVRFGVSWADGTESHVGVIAFSNEPKMIFSLNETTTIAEFKQRIFDTPYMNGENRGDLAIDLALEEFHKYSEHRLKNLVFITGGATKSLSDTAQAADKVVDEGIRVYAVGVGQEAKADHKELLMIAGNRTDNVFEIAVFDNLSKLLQPLSMHVCTK